MNDSNGAITAVIIGMHGNEEGVITLKADGLEINHGTLDRKNIDTILLLACFAGQKNKNGRSIATDFMIGNNVKNVIASDGVVGSNRVSTLIFFDHRTNYISNGGFYRFYRDKKGVIQKDSISGKKSFNTGIYDGGFSYSYNYNYNRLSDVLRAAFN